VLGPSAATHPAGSLRGMYRCILAMTLLGCGGAATMNGAGPGTGTGGDEGTGGGARATETIVDTATAELLTIVGAPATTNGISDVALVYDAVAARGTLTFTGVDIESGQPLLRTRIASSTDAGQTWTYLGDVNQPQVTTIDSTDTTECPSGTCPGAIVNEVSSIVDDGGDPDASRRFKVFTHRYFWIAASPTPGYAYGHIAMATAPAPAGPWTAAPLIGWPSPSSFSSAGVPMTTTNLGLSCLILTEPSAVIEGATLLLAVGCVADATTIRVELLASSDHGVTFTRKGTLVDSTDAVALGASAPRVNAAHLFRAGDVTQVLVSPGDAGGDYLGCAVLRLDATDAIERNADHTPSVLRSFDAPGWPDRGACAFAEGATGTGYVINVPEPKTALFRVFKTGVPAP
jgi:hypothetical protein